MAKYSVYGPFEVPRNGRLVSSQKREQARFWDSIDDKEDALSSAIGCYVFVIGAGAKYIGMTWRRSFRKECLSHRNLNIYNDALQTTRSRPKLILIARETRHGGFARPIKRNSETSIKFLESILIYEALKNKVTIHNTSGAVRIRKTTVPGLLNTGQGHGRARAVSKLRRALRI